MNKITLLVLCGLSSSLSFAQDDVKWAQYCDKDQNIVRLSPATPKVNYQNKLIIQAAEKLNKVSPDSFYQYAEIEKIYGLCNGRSKKSGKCTEDQLPKIENLKVDTHNFLTILCGEFRDNLKMLEAKLKWVASMNIVSNGKQEYTKNADVFEQITAQGYFQLLKFSESLYSARENKLENSNPSLELTQNSVQAVTICENRYIFSEYLSKNISFLNTTLDQYEKNYTEFKKTCTKSDLAHYYEYRGDGNFKAQTLESNAYIFVARDFANSCESTSKALKGTVLSDSDCSNYFSKPFTTRSKISEQGLRRLFFYPDTITRGNKVIDLNAKMTDYSDEVVFITEDLNNDDIADMVILEDTLQGNERSISARGADTLLEAREMVKDLRQEAQYLDGKAKTLSFELANAYKKAIHFIAATEALNQVKDSPKKQAIIKARSSSRGYISYKLPQYKNDIIQIAKDDEDTAESLNDIVEKLELIIAQKEFLGVVVVTEVMQVAGKNIDASAKLNETFPDKQKAWDRITVVLDRHTDWYQIDSINISLAQYAPTYSPWLASSYYINKSDNFTKPGYAMGIEGDGHRHWMFVQKVPVKRWFTANDLENSTDWKKHKIDILNTWFDETTFSRSSLGQHEQGWDRFGSAKEDEVGKIFYMYNASELEE